MMLPQTRTMKWLASGQLSEKGLPGSTGWEEQGTVTRVAAGLGQSRPSP